MGKTVGHYGNFSKMSPNMVARWARGALALPELRIVDTETNGHGQPWDNEPAEIVEICIIDSTGAPLLNTLVKPSGTIHPEAAAKSGINHDLLQDAKPFSELAHQIAQLLYGKAVVIYNAEFDDSLLTGRVHEVRTAQPIIRGSLCDARLSYIPTTRKCPMDASRASL